MIYLKLIDSRGNEIKIYCNDTGKFELSILNGHGTCEYTMNDYDIEKFIYFIKLIKNERL